MKRYPNLDLLRLFLALEVMYLHWGMHYFKPVLWIDPVPTFVCLSGLLIPKSFGDSKSWKHFAWKRAIRVYPAFFAAILLSVLLHGIGSGYASLAAYLTLGVIFIPLADYPLWSLALEEILYAGHVISRSLRIWNVWTALACMTACSEIMLLTHSNPHLSTIFRVAAAFFAGNIGAFYIARLGKLNGWMLLALFASVLIGGRFVWGASAVGAFIAPLLTLCLVLGVRNTPQVPWRFPDISYGVYVYQVPILLSVIGLPAIISGPVLLVTVLAAATISWHLIEKPILSLKDRPWSIKAFRSWLKERHKSSLRIRSSNRKRDLRQGARVASQGCTVAVHEAQLDRVGVCDVGGLRLDAK